MDFSELTLGIDEYTSLPTLYKLGANSSIRVWTISYADGKIKSEWGAEGRDFQESVREISTNSSGRSPLEQAKQEAEYRWNKKQNIEGFRQDRPKAEFFTGQSMRANKWDPEKNQIKEWPVWIQPKYDGLRCMAYIDQEGEIILRTRGNKLVHHLSGIREQAGLALKQLQHFSGDDLVILDGEIFCWELEFEVIDGLVTKTKADQAFDDEELLSFYVFDCNTQTQRDYKERYNLIKKSCKDLDRLCVAPVYLAKDKKSVVKACQKFQKQGYEGVMIRKIHGEYKYSRCTEIYKYKGDRKDTEGEIIEGKAEQSVFGPAILWRLRLVNGKEISVRPKGHLPGRVEIYKDYMKNPEMYHGKLFRIEYQKLSKYDIPIHPVGICFVHDRTMDDVVME